MEDQNTSSEPVEETEAPEPAPAPVEPDSGQSTGSKPANVPSEAPESPINDSSSTPVEDQNPPINQPLIGASQDLRPESEGSEEPISAPNESEAPVDDQPSFTDF